MRQEQEVRSGVHRNITETIKDRAMYYAVSAAGPVISAGTEKIIRRSRFEYQAGFWEQFTQAMLEGYVPILLANHQSHFDGVSMSEIAKRLSDRAFLEGFQMPLASSLDNGDQGGKMRAFYEAQKKTLRKNRVYPLILTREKDREKYGEEGNPMPAINRLKTAVQGGFGILEFPEGETTGGKIDRVGLRNGMIPFQEDAIRILIATLKRTKRRGIIIPVSIDGGFRILDPDSKLPTRHALRVGLGFKEESHVTFRIGLPLKTDQGELGDLVSVKNWGEVSEMLGRQIASGLPDPQRGVYG